MRTAHGYVRGEGACDAPSFVPTTPVSSDQAIRLSEASAERQNIGTPATIGHDVYVCLVRATQLGLLSLALAVTAGCSRECLAIGVGYSGQVVIDVPVPPGSTPPDVTICIDQLCGSTATNNPALPILQYDGRFTAFVPIGSNALAPKAVTIVLRVAGSTPTETSIEAHPAIEEPNGKGCTPRVRVVRLALDASSKTLVDRGGPHT